MLGTGIVIFSIVSAVLCFVVISKYDKFEKSELTSYLLIFVWGSFLFGLSLPKLTAMVQLVSPGR